jgi:hypothetical protein
VPGIIGVAGIIGPPGTAHPQSGPIGAPQSPYIMGVPQPGIMVQSGAGQQLEWQQFL